MSIQQYSDEDSWSDVEVTSDYYATRTTSHHQPKETKLEGNSSSRMTTVGVNVKVKNAVVPAGKDGHGTLEKIRLQAENNVLKDAFRKERSNRGRMDKTPIQSAGSAPSRATPKAKNSTPVEDNPVKPPPQPSTNKSCRTTKQKGTTEEKSSKTTGKKKESAVELRRKYLLAKAEKTRKNRDLMQKAERTSSEEGKEKTIGTARSSSSSVMTVASNRHSLVPATEVTKSGPKCGSVPNRGIPQAKPDIGNLMDAVIERQRREFMRFKELNSKKNHFPNRDE